MGKRFIVTFFAATLLLCLLFASVIYFSDPYFVFRTPADDAPLRLHDGRYQNAGVARNFDYDTLILGTSVSANFHTEQFDTLLGAKTAKLIVLGGFFSDFEAALNIAFDTHTVKQVFWGIDSNILGRRETDKTDELPDYLYNKNPLDDVKYLLNKEVFFSESLELLRLKKLGMQDDRASGGYLWGYDLTWSKQQALMNYQRPALTDTPLADDALLPAAQENLAVILRLLQQHPDTEFNFYLAPYSILFWDMCKRSGKLDATIEMQRYVLHTLVAYPNVRIHYFMDDYALITNLDCYGDHVHYSPAISAQLGAAMIQGTPLAADEIDTRLDALYDFVQSYPFDDIWVIQ